MLLISLIAILPCVVAGGDYQIVQQPGEPLCDTCGSKSTETSVNVESASTANAASNSLALGGNNRNSIEIGGGTGPDLRDTVPSVNPPGLHGSITGLCAFSASGGIALPGFGLSGGKVMFSELCERIEASKALYQLGMTDAASEILCDIGFIHAARERASKRFEQEGDMKRAMETRCLRDVHDDKKLAYDTRSKIEKRYFDFGDDSKRNKRNNDKK